MALPLTERQELEQLRVRVAELEEEVAAWRAVDERVPHDAEVAITEVLRPHLAGTYRQHARLAARTLLCLLQTAPRAQPFDLLGERIARGDVENPSRLSALGVAAVRSVCRRLGLGEVLTTLRGVGVILAVADARRIRQALGLADG